MKHTPEKYGAVQCSTIAKDRYAGEERRSQMQMQYVQGLEDGYGHAIFEHAAPLELKVQEQADELAKLRALVQKILDLSFHDGECNSIIGMSCDCLKSVIDATAKEAGFTPTNTTEG